MGRGLSVVAELVDIVVIDWHPLRLSVPSPSPTPFVARQRSTMHVYVIWFKYIRGRCRPGKHVPGLEMFISAAEASTKQQHALIPA